MGPFSAVNRHATVLPMRHNVPSLDKTSWVAPSGMVSGSVTLGENSSVWYGAIVRGKSTPCPCMMQEYDNESMYVNIGKWLPAQATSSQWSWARTATFRMQPTWAPPASSAGQ